MIPREFIAALHKLGKNAENKFTGLTFQSIDRGDSPMEIGKSLGKLQGSMELISAAIELAETWEND